VKYLAKMTARIVVANAEFAKSYKAQDQISRRRTGVDMGDSLPEDSFPDKRLSLEVFAEGADMSYATYIEGRKPWCDG